MSFRASNTLIIYTYVLFKFSWDLSNRLCDAQLISLWVSMYSLKNTSAAFAVQCWTQISGSIRKK